MLGLCQMEKKPVETMTVADRLLKSMQDPWLNAYRIAGLVSQNRIKEAREAIAASKAAVPNVSVPYVAELGMLMQLKNHQETAQAIETLETKFGENMVKLTSFPEFEEFLKLRNWPAISCSTCRLQFLNRQLTGMPR